MCRRVKVERTGVKVKEGHVGVLMILVLVTGIRLTEGLEKEAKEKSLCTVVLEAMVEKGPNIGPPGGERVVGLR